PAAFDIARTRKVALEALDMGLLADDVVSLANAIRERLAEGGSVAPRFEVALGFGYTGQSYHVSVPGLADRIARPGRAGLLRGFAGLYRAKYGYFYADVPVELVSVHVTGIAEDAAPVLPQAPQRGSAAKAVIFGQRHAWSARQRAFVPFTVYRRDDLAPGMRFAGPCLVEEDTATTVIDVGGRVVVDRLGSLDVSVTRQE